MATESPPPPPPDSLAEFPSDSLLPPLPNMNSNDLKRQAKPHATLLRLGLAPLIIHFKSNGYIQQSILESYDVRIFKRTLGDSARQEDVRAELGPDIKTWNDLRDILRAAVPSLSDRCFSVSKADRTDENGNDLDYDTADAPSAREIAKNYNSLIKDLVRLNMLCSIARNILVIGETAQSAAAKALFDKALFELIRLCVRVTARPYGSYDSPANVDTNGNATNGADTAKTEEDKFNGVATEYKSLLTRCLQVMNNLVAQNERRKLMLWVELFDERGADGVVEREIDAVSRIVPAPHAQGREDVKSVNKAISQVLEGKKKAVEPEVVEGDQPLALDAWHDEGQDDLYPQPGQMFDVERAFRDTGSEDGGMYPNPGMQFKLPQVLRGLRNEFEYFDGEEEQRNIPEDSDEIFRSSPYLRWLKENSETLKREHQATGTIAIPADFDDERQTRLQIDSEEDLLWWQQYEKVLRGIDEGLQPPGDDSEALRDRGLEFGTLHSLQRDMRDKTPTTAGAERQLSVELEGLKITKEFESTDPAYKHFAPTWSTQAADGEDTFNAYVSFDGGKASQPEAATEDDYRPTYGAGHGTSILERGKADLLKRLEPDTDRPYRGRQPERRRASSDASVPHSTTTTGHYSPTIPSDVVEVESAEESEEDDYPIPGDDGRGLLTDIPLILGPSEIEVLPMIIQSAICPPPPGNSGYGKTPQEIAAVKNMHTVRCHLLLAQDNGRNLLRELLIFVAAWDLREDELYFKLMVKIMEAVLINGLMPFAYRAFRESKDIISPAQAVVLKLLTTIFRQRQAAHSPPRGAPKDSDPQQSDEPYPQRVDVQTVSFLLTEFRRTIIPQTCVLIFLQAKIRDGTVSPEDFPLNLWDMERMYEGVYQYLEFFAILTEHEGWKGMMADWEVVSELISLLEELDNAIPRSTPANQAMKERQGELLAKQSEALKEAVQKGREKWERVVQQVNERAAAGTTAQAQTQTQQPVSVERPYDLSNSPVLPPPSEPNEQIPLPPPSTLAPPPPPPPEDEPSEFEWRNLKKLAVLVLSSLTWKNKRIQQQLNVPDKNGIPGRGLRVLLSCCGLDDFNPFIREHGIMALRFALEGNEKGMGIVRDLVSEKVEQSGEGSAAAAAGAGEGPTGKKIEVPREVLDLRGYETFVDAKGQVQLRRREKR